ncbi:Ankyrin repeat domain 49 [Chamberlinius hualienensis]
MDGGTELAEQLLTAAEEDDVDFIKSLLDKKLSIINAQDDDGYTALHRTAYSNKPKVAKYLLSRGADVDMVTLDGWQPLHSACRWNSIEVVQLLVNSGADVNARTKGGQTPLHIAASQQQSREVLKFLLSLPHIEVNLKNSCKDTPYEIAKRSGRNADLFEQ